MFDSITSFATKNPLITGLGLGVGMSLLQSLMSNSGSSNSASDNGGTSPYSSGTCTTQYYLTSDPNLPYTDPCAQYNPSAATQTQTNPTDTSLTDLLSKLNNPAVNITFPGASTTQSCPLPTVFCGTGFVTKSQTGTDANGCPLPSICVAANSSCPVVLKLTCGTGFQSQSGGTDANGCEINTCVPVTNPIVNSISNVQCPLTVLACAPGYMLQSNGMDANGCAQSVCNPGQTACPTIVKTTCDSGFVSQSGGTDQNGCAINTCVLASNPITIPTSNPIANPTPTSNPTSNPITNPTQTTNLDTNPITNPLSNPTPTSNPASNPVPNPMATPTPNPATNPQCPVNVLSCNAGYQLQTNGVDQNGCAVSSCIKTANTALQCPALTVPNCTDSQTLQNNGADSKGCPLQSTCVASSQTAPINTNTNSNNSPTNSTPVPVTPTNTGTPGTTDTTGDTGTYQTPVPIQDILANNQQYFVNTTGPDTPAPAQTPLNQPLSAQMPPEGLHGDITTFGSGATVYANSVSHNTEVAGFFGATGTAAELCASRPWATNFLSYIIPPAFFDNLCSWGGYPTGAITNVQGGAGTGLGGTQTVSVSGPSSNTTPVYNNGVQTSATIWAQPKSVSLGGRTTIFWTSQNVTSCTESSSDGNFTGSSTSGGASTVALSGPVTFTITCNGIDGKPITNSTTVRIGI